MLENGVAWFGGRTCLRGRALLHLIRVVGRAPLQWQVGKIAPTPKHNGKEGCLAFRPICVLDPIGMPHTSALWKKAVYVPHAFSMGFAECRRKEEGTFMVRVVMWRLSRQRRQWAAIFFDVANAFPSVEWQAVDQQINDKALC